MNEFQRICEKVSNTLWHTKSKFCKTVNCYCNLCNCEECMKELHIDVDITAKTPEGEKHIDEGLKDLESLNHEDDDLKIQVSY